MQVTTSTDSEQAARCKELVAGEGGGDIKANCERWWLPRPQPLGSYSELDSVSFEFKVSKKACMLLQSCHCVAEPCFAFNCWVQPASKPDNDDVVFTEFRYWAGYYWQIKLANDEGKLGLYALPSVNANASTSFKENGMQPGLQVVALALAIHSTSMRLIDWPSNLVAGQLHHLAASH